MHILVVNDDGPPNPTSSPYIQTFVRVLTSPPFNHKVSVVLPETQRSWIGKAHLLPPSDYTLAVSQDKVEESAPEIITPCYYIPDKDEVYSKPPPQEVGNYWVAVPGTPATCVQLGLFHHSILFPHRKLVGRNSDKTYSPSALAAIDLVISGPNFGRNTSAAFALSSGTIGGAMEACICGVRAIALSFAFYTRKESLGLIEEACFLSARIIGQLCDQWHGPLHYVNGTMTPSSNTDRLDPKSVPDLYTINVPLVEGVKDRPIQWTHVLDNKWNTASSYKVMKKEGDELANGDDVGPSFKWSPNFADVWKTLDVASLDSDGRAVREKCISVTPLKANFQHMPPEAKFEGELTLIEKNAVSL